MSASEESSPENPKYSGNDHDGRSAGRGRGNGRGRCRGRGRSRGGGRGRGGRQEQGRARGGRSRGRGTDEQARGGQSRNEKSGRGRNKHQGVVEVFTNDFLQMHSKCRAARYKIHKTGCDCTGKIKTILASSNKRFVDDQEIRQNSIYTPGGLIVLPDFKIIRFLYWYRTSLTDDIDCRTIERNLLQQMYPETNVTNDLTEESASSPQPPPLAFKYSCAACLLKEVPNGFACVASTDRTSLEKVRDNAREAALQILQTGQTLNADHAHYIVVLPKEPLQQLYQFIKPNKKLSQALKANSTADGNVLEQAQDEIYQHLSNQGVPIQLDSDVPIAMDHHLASVVRHFIEDSNNNQDEQWWLVLVFDDTKDPSPNKQCWTLFLPGGKRHLSESAMEGARRETLEESSVAWDETWVQQEFDVRDDRFNRYFLLCPPE